MARARRAGRLASATPAATSGSAPRGAAAEGAGRSAGVAGAAAGRGKEEMTTCDELRETMGNPKLMATNDAFGPPKR